MDSGTVDSPVTLVIKAPNQKYDDQTINCFLNWTVEKLKSHISIVYPSKPSSKDQRLVYSGKLLQDHMQLRDVLRKQDEYHMMHLVCASHSPPPSPTPRSPSLAAAHTSARPAPANERVRAALGPNAAPDPLPDHPPANNNANIQMNAQGGAVLQDDELNRDWLDRLYAVSRAGVLLGIVYFYSSFSRFVMVLGAMLLVYLHQAGWFPFRAEQQQQHQHQQDPVEGGERDEAQREEAERRQDIQEIERLMDEGMEEDDSTEEEEGGGAAGAAAAGGGGEGGEEQSQAQNALQQPGFLTATWSFISTFFTSLIPEGRPQPAN
ncbi:hypothetical protein CRUP_029593 [Coryphaenoides rupestris]|nr:hypothetical protein CRUP_029593 [Coryphaenoides rupestris]